MSYQVYKVLHLVSIMGIILSLGAITLHVMNGGDKKFPNRKWVMITHGIGMTIALVAGFGLMARLGMMHGGFPVWIWGKLAIWFVFGGIVSAIPRFPKKAGIIWILILVLGGSAAWLANYKPGHAAAVNVPAVAPATETPQ